MKPILVHNLSKSYNGVEALKGISLKVDEGELFGLIGPDGAGKTTLFRILATLLKPDRGSAQVSGLDAVSDYRKIRPLLGYMPGKFSLYSDLSVRENLEFFASVFGTSIEENYELVKPIYSQLEPFSDRLAGALSGGMKQKLALSCALIHRPRVLLLDEPTTGVDAVSRKEFWDMLDHLKAAGITIMVSTPYMDEAARCERVALIQDGRIMKTDLPGEVTKAFQNPLFRVKAADKYRLIQVLREHESCKAAHPFGEFVHFTDRSGSLDADQIENYLLKRDMQDVYVERTRPGIEDTFMQLMQEEHADG